MLHSLTSRELSEWMAYERRAGPVGGTQYIGEVLAGIYELTQRTHHLMGAAHFTPEGDENPISAPGHFPRPWDPPVRD